MPPDFFNPEKEYLENGDKLPHWQQGEVLQFVTFRLADSVPLEMAKRWRKQRSLWLSAYPEPWDAVTER